jgi:hypothetical protein
MRTAFASPEIQPRTFADSVPPALGERPPISAGPAAAAIVAAGVGSAALGLAIVLVEASPDLIKKWLNLYDPVGPLSGKTTVAVAIFFATWIVLALYLRGREVRFGRWCSVGFALLAVGLILSFPPVFQLFTKH